MVKAWGSILFLFLVCIFKYQSNIKFLANCNVQGFMVAGMYHLHNLLQGTSNFQWQGILLFLRFCMIMWELISKMGLVKKVFLFIFISRGWIFKMAAEWPRGTMCLPHGGIVAWIGFIFVASSLSSMFLIVWFI